MDIVERLRELSTYDVPGLKYAADEIERLRIDLEVAEDRKAKAQLFHNDMLKEIERLQQLVSELNSVAYVIDGHGIAHHNFTIVYKELE